MKSERISRLREAGAVGVFRATIDVIRNSLLRRRYGFDRWHARSTYGFQPYKARVVECVDAMGASSVAEIGCGLGDIVSRVRAPNRIGIDIDAAVLRAARQLHPDVTFLRGDLDEASHVLQDAGTTRIEAVIMVNWPHLKSIDSLVAATQRLKSSHGVRMLVIDGIRKGVPGYLYHHSPREISELGSIRKVLPEADRVRDLFVVDLAGPRTTEHGE